MPRNADTTYQDPVDLIWLATAGKFGMQVVRDDSVFASWDGNGKLTIGSPDTLDPDDCLAQMILHEICHALIEGPESFTKPDWGVDITNPTDRVREYACLRLQAALTGQYGLRQMLAATTNFRRYYDALSTDSLADADDPAIEIARAGWTRAKQGPWSTTLDDALRQTAAIASIVQSIAPRDSLWSRSEKLDH